MTPLHEQLLRRIDLTGPIPLHEYWAICLFDPEYGYYTTRVPIGSKGDFTTAPEISQMFGELLAVWWLGTVRQNRLANVQLVEIGPGRSTLMADVLRTLAKLDPSLQQTLKVHLVEVSPRLTAMQKEKLSSSGFDVIWHKTPDTLPLAPLGIVANELFDAIPVRAFTKHGDQWLEQAVAAGEGNALRFTAHTARLDGSILPQGHESQPDGTVFEYAPAREAFMAMLAERIKAHRGFGLFIDYGHQTSGFGDTVQAIKGHEYAHPLENPGEADLTSHVDFEALAQAAQNHGLTCPPLLNQGEFLKRLGILERTERLAMAQPDKRDNIETACERLIAPDQMGNLFKVLTLSSADMTLPAFDWDS